MKITTWTAIATVLIALAVIAEAFGAHAFKEILLANQRTETYELAARYHFYHAFGILIISLIEFQKNKLTILWTMLLGIVFFSGSLYVLSLSGQKWLGAITPVGGFCFILAWLITSLELFKKAKQ